MTDRERARRYRQRKAAGLRVLRVAVEQELIDALIEQGALDAETADHDPDLEDAIRAALAILVTRDDPADDEATMTPDIAEEQITNADDPQATAPIAEENARGEPTH